MSEGKTTFTIQSLWRLALWGCTAAVALLFVILASRSGPGSQRTATVLASLTGSSASPPPVQPGKRIVRAPAPPRFDAQAVTRQLALEMHGLARDQSRLVNRLAAVEQSVGDITGSVTRQIEAVKKKVSPPPWPVDQFPLAMTPETIAALLAPTPPPISGLPPLPSTPLAPNAEEPAASAPPPSTVGVDIGGALSIQTLRARWLNLRSAHPQIFAGLQPVATLRDIPRSKRVELRLVIGPLASTAAATRLCASLAALRLFCEPTSFGTNHLALE